MKKKKPKTPSVKKLQAQIETLEKQLRHAKLHGAFMEADARTANWYYSMAWKEADPSGIYANFGRRVLEAINKKAIEVTPGLLQSIVTRLHTMRPPLPGIPPAAQAPATQGADADDYSGRAKC